MINKLSLPLLSRMTVIYIDEQKIVLNNYIFENN